MIRQRRKSYFDTSNRIAECVQHDNRQKQSNRPESEVSKIHSVNKQPTKSKKSNQAPKSQNQSEENDTITKQLNELSKFLAPDQIRGFMPKIVLRRLSMNTMNHLIATSEKQYHNRSKTPIDQNGNRIETEPPMPIQYEDLDESVQTYDSSASNQEQPNETLILQHDEMLRNSPENAVPIIHSDYELRDDVSSNGNSSGRSSVISDQTERAKSQCESDEKVPNSEAEIEDEEITFHDETIEEIIFAQSSQGRLEMGQANFTEALENTSHSFDSAQKPLVTPNFTREPVNNNDFNSKTSFIESVVAQQNERLCQFEAIEPPKCFVDSSKVSYSAIVKFNGATFSVNHFDHRDKSIEHHFLSKFDRAHFPALSTFEGTLWVSETTGRLISEYSLIDHSRINVLEFGQAVNIAGITVTAIEVPKFPGGALFLFQSLNERSILHVGNLRLPYELEENVVLKSHYINGIFFDRSILSQLLYQFPTNTDRYRNLMNEVTRFIEGNSRSSGRLYLIAVGAFEIGMEYFIYELSQHCRNSVYINHEHRQFLRHMETDDESNTVIQKLRRQLVDVSVLAKIHVFNVDEINEDFLLEYIRQHNFHRVLGIRPRGHSATPQTVIEVKNCKILDIANPLIGDTAEYEKFVKLNVQ